jgi:hypothetical protein
VKNQICGVFGKPEGAVPPINQHEGKIFSALENRAQFAQFTGQQPLQNHMLLRFPNTVAELAQIPGGTIVQPPHFGPAPLLRAQGGFEHGLALDIPATNPQTIFELNLQLHSREKLRAIIGPRQAANNSTGKPQHPLFDHASGLTCRNRDKLGGSAGEAAGVR